MGSDVRDLAFAVAMALGIAFGGAISNSVMLWMLGFPLAFGSSIALGTLLLRATDLSTARRWVRGFGAVLIFGGGLALSASAVFIDWPQLPRPTLGPAPLDAAMLHGIGITWLLRAAAVALGFHLLEPERWRRAVVLFFLLSLVVPVKLVIWKALYEVGLIVLSA